VIPPILLDAAKLAVHGITEYECTPGTPRPHTKRTCYADAPFFPMPDFLSDHDYGCVKVRAVHRKQKATVTRPLPRLPEKMNVRRMTKTSARTCQLSTGHIRKGVNLAAYFWNLAGNQKMKIGPSAGQPALYGHRRHDSVPRARRHAAHGAFSVKAGRWRQPITPTIAMLECRPCSSLPIGHFKTTKFGNWNTAPDDIWNISR
jgi:hypothetical protein